MTGVKCVLIEITYKQHVDIGFHNSLKKVEVPSANILYLVNDELVKILLKSVRYL